MSTISPRRGRDDEGQVLVLFAGALVTLLIVAALAFDVGMVLVSRRDQQNAADAASLAGARYVLTSGNFSGTCSGSESTGNAAVDAACRVAADNGFGPGDPSHTVHVYIPAIHGRYAGLPHFVEVQIDANRPSIFAGIIGRAVWPVGALGVATNGQNLTFPFGMIALNPTMCKAIQVSGTGTINSYGTIQSNSNGSDCTSGEVGFSRTGGSTINVLAADAYCRSVSDIQDQGSGAMTCTKAPDSFALPDPLRALPAPAKPGIPAAMDPVPGNTKAIPSHCPGSISAPPSETSPALCTIGSGSSKDVAWILHPGLYPGGIKVTQNNTVYLLPGNYWIGGGGLQVQNGSMVTIATPTDANADPSLATWGGGVLIYNSKLPAAAGGPIDLNGGSAVMKLKPYEAPSPTDPTAIYNNIVIFQDRTMNVTGDDVTLNGSSSTTSVLGLIYVPAGSVKLNGNSGTLNVDQIIADSYLIDGNAGTINVDKGTNFESTIVAAGLVD